MSNPASPKQVEFINSLRAQIGLDPADQTLIDQLDKKTASAVIKGLLETVEENKAAAKGAYIRPAMPGAPTNEPQPAPQADHGVPAGRYAIDHEGTLKFYKVDAPTEGRWAGYVFVKVMASDTEYPIRNRQAREGILSLIRAAGPLDAAKRYGHEIGACGICGKTLTREESIAAGIGPICANKF